MTIFTFILLGACSDYTLSDPKENPNNQPNIVVDPDYLVFDLASVEAPQALAFTISNDGNASLSVDDLQLVGSQSFQITALEGARSLTPGESMDVAVTYSPDQIGADDSGAVLVFSNDPADSTVEVSLNGFVYQPILIVDPQILDLGLTPLGEALTGELTLRSIGDAPVTIESLSVSGTAFNVSSTETWPLELLPGEESVLTVDFPATDGGVQEESVTIDCAEPAADVSAQLLAEVQLGTPIAVCSVDPIEVQPNAETATFYGGDSYDAEGFAITDYQWTLKSKPGGSTMSLNSSSASVNFSPDLAGEYEAELVVYNELGSPSEPCVATLTAVPGEDLWIQMYWAQPGDDFDLHLVRHNGAMESNDDCYYGNCKTNGGAPVLDWGVIGDTSDDPGLDIDDIPGVGPENINMSNPESGVFKVYAHDFPGSTYEAGNDVTVVIYVGGSMVWTDTRTVQGEGQYTLFAEIEWPSGVVTGM